MKPAKSLMTGRDVKKEKKTALDFKIQNVNSGTVTSRKVVLLYV
jgi:hypothetical protein